MALLNQSVQVYGKLSKLFDAMRAGQAPEKFNRAYLKDLGFKSSNFHACIPLLKGMGFLTSDGTPTQRYKDFLDSTKWQKIIAETIREAYSDIFVVKSKPTKSDRDLVAGKYKSTYNLSETSADRTAQTFLALLDLADEKTLYGKPASPAAKLAENTKTVVEAKEPAPVEPAPVAAMIAPLGLHYNIQIHLPATKDVEVYNAIFKSLSVRLEMS